jgi:hypothetical protein
MRMPISFPGVAVALVLFVGSGPLASTAAQAQAHLCDRGCREKCDATAGRPGQVSIPKCYEIWGRINSSGRSLAERRALEGQVVYHHKTGRVFVKGSPTQTVVRVTPLKLPKAASRLKTSKAVKLKKWSRR